MDGCDCELVRIGVLVALSLCATEAALWICAYWDLLLELPRDCSGEHSRKPAASMLEILLSSDLGLF